MSESVDASTTAFLHDLIGIAGAMQAQVLATDDPLHAAVLLPLGPNRNHLGTAYAGSIFTASELLGGILALRALPADGYVPLLRSMEIDYLRPATGDVVARAHLPAEEAARVSAEAGEQGRSAYELTAEVSLADGTVVARTVGQYQLRRL